MVVVMRLISRVVVVLCGWCGALSSAHEGHDQHDAPQPYAVKKQYRPTPIPDRIVLTWSDDPATTVNVTWRTSVDVRQSIGQYAEAASLVGDMQFGDVKHAQQVTGSLESFTSDLGEAHVHSLKLANLRAATTYAYRVGDGVNWSEWFHFTTAANQPAPFSFIYFGDAQNAVRSLWSRVVRDAHSEAPRAAFMLHAGDLINQANADNEWGEWFSAGGFLNAMIPSIATPGNHEYGLSVTGSQLTGHWRPQFAFPLNGPPGLEETAYYLDYQGARIISLNSNERQQEQIAWLEEVLKNNPHRWTIVTFHHPVYSAAKDRDNANIRNWWKPLFDRYGVDLVLQGHDHSYARSAQGGPKNVNVPDGVRGQQANTVYVVSVSGPKMYPLGEAWQASRNASGVQLYQVIKVSPERVQYEARLATGELYDAFTLIYRAGQTNELIEQAPPTPEIRK
jgi:3',5'-cyclic AMP phosphodiesterase CpdA